MTHGAREDFHRLRRAQIIASAKVCFSRAGYHGGSMVDLTKESGLGPGQLYRYFPSKTSLINAVVQDLAKEWRGYLFSKIRADFSLADILDRRSAFWAGWSKTNQTLLVESYSESARNASVRNALLKEEEALVAQIISGRESDDEKKLSQRQVRLILLIIDGFICRVFEDGDLDRQELRRLEGIIKTVK